MNYRKISIYLIKPHIRNISHSSMDGMKYRMLWQLTNLFSSDLRCSRLHRPGLCGDLPGLDSGPSSDHYRGPGRGQSQPPADLWQPWSLSLMSGMSVMQYNWKYMDILIGIYEVWQVQRFKILYIYRWKFLDPSVYDVSYYPHLNNINLVTLVISTGFSIAVTVVTCFCTKKCCHA